MVNITGLIGYNQSHVQKAMSNVSCISVVSKISFLDGAYIKKNNNNNNG